MRMLVLVTDAFGGHGGIAQYNRDFLTAVAAADPTGEIVVLPRNGVSARSGLPSNVTQLAPRRGWLAYSLAAIACAWRRGPFDVVFCGHLYQAPLAALLARRLRARFWLQLYGIEAWTCPSRWRRRAAEAADLVTVISRYTRGRFLTWARVQPWKARVLPCTVEERFAPGPRPAALIERYGLANNKVLLTVGRLAATERYKGHDQVIRALPALRQRFPELVYVIAGDGDDRARLEALAMEMGVAEAVQFVGRVPEEDLPELYRLADVYVMPSTGEGFGIVFLEALASGVPAVGALVAGAADALQEGRLGRPATPETLTSVIGDLLARDKQNDAPFAAAVRRIFGTQAYNDLVRELLAVA